MAEMSSREIFGRLSGTKSPPSTEIPWAIAWAAVTLQLSLIHIYIAFDVLHSVVNSHTGSDGTTGAVDIKVDIFIGVLALQIKELGHDERGSGVVDLLTQHDDPVV